MTQRTTPSCIRFDRKFYRFRSCVLDLEVPLDFFSETIDIRLEIGNMFIHKVVITLQNRKDRKLIVR